MSSIISDGGRQQVVVAPLATHNDRINLIWAALAGVASVAAHAILFLLIWQITLDQPLLAAEIETTSVLQKAEPELDLTLTDIGDNPEVPLTYKVDRKDDVSIPGPVDPVAKTGIPNSQETIKLSVPPPPGAGGGTGASPLADIAGLGTSIGTLGGMGGIYQPGGIGGRSGSRKDDLLLEGGGNAMSEAAVARGLLWLALHQAPDGHWGLNDFDKYARTEPLPAGKILPKRYKKSEPQTTMKNDIAGTAFGLLPFLGAGHTHKAPTKKQEMDYSKPVMAGLNYLMSKQGKDGNFGGEMYAHGLATIAMCEAFGLTSDPKLQASAQKGIDYILNAQDPQGGGWRYQPKSPGDTSVTGWQIMALKSAQMSGLKVNAAKFKDAEKFIDSVQVKTKGGAKSYGGTYAYMPGSTATPTMTSVGMLCKLYLGTGSNNKTLLDGASYLKATAPPGATKDIYYEYYATQVFHHMGGEMWNFWNLGPEGKGKGGLRDSLIAKQEVVPYPEKKTEICSWPREGTSHGTSGGRIMATSLSLLSLEVYYRHLPLYRSDLGVTKGK